MPEFPNLDYRILSEAKFKKEARYDNYWVVSSKDRRYKIEIYEEGGHNLFNLSVDEINPETGDTVREIYYENDPEVISELIEDGFFDWKNPDAFVEYLDKMGKIPDAEKESRDLETEWSREGKVKLANEEAEAPEEEAVVPDITPEKMESEFGNTMQGGVVEQVNKLISEGNYVKALDIVLDLKLTKGFDIKELSSHLKHGQLINLIEKYNLNLKDLVSTERITAMVESIKKVVKMYEQKRRSTDDSLTDFLNSPTFKGALSASKLLDFDLMAYVKETYPREFYEYPSITQEKKLEDVKKLREKKVTDGDHREFAYTVVPMKSSAANTKSEADYTFSFAINSTDEIFPAEIFETLNKHHATGDKPVAFVFGTYTPGKVLYVDEMQSDIIQRAQMYMQPKDKALQKFRDRIKTLSEQYGYSSENDRGISKEKLDSIAQLTEPELIKRLKDLGVKDEIENIPGEKDSVMKLTDMNISELRAFLLDTVNDRIDKDKKNIERASSWSNDFMPQYEQFRSKIQNYFSGWNIICMNTVLNFARDNNIPTVYVASADLLYQKWKSHQSGDFTIALYKRMYDDMVQSTYGAVRKGDWYKIELKDVMDKIAKKNGMKKRAIREEEWDIWTYDIWGNEEEGWEVNDRSKWGIVVLPESPTLAQIIKALRRIEFLGGVASTETVEEDGSSDENNIYLNESATGKPICGLERIPDTSSEREQTGSEKDEKEIETLENEWKRDGSMKKKAYDKEEFNVNDPNIGISRETLNSLIEEMQTYYSDGEESIGDNYYLEMTMEKSSAGEQGYVYSWGIWDNEVKMWVSKVSSGGTLYSKEELIESLEKSGLIKNMGEQSVDYEKDGRNLMEFENDDLTLPELESKLKIAIEGHEDDELINLIKTDIEKRKQKKAHIVDQMTVEAGDLML